MATYSGPSRSQWVLPLIILIALLGLAGYLLNKNKDDVKDAIATASPTVTASATANASATITDLGTLQGSSAAASLAGRSVDIAAANVLTVTGDKTFSIGGTGTAPVYVALASNLDDSSGAEQATQIAAGQTVHVVGTVMAMPSLSEIKAMWGLSDADAATAQAFGAYVSATTANVIVQ